jgi:hypothetical protein
MRSCREGTLKRRDHKGDSYLHSRMQNVWKSYTNRLTNEHRLLYKECAYRGPQGFKSKQIRRNLLVQAKDGTFGDDLLDFMQAGRKLRRWYGENERQAEREERKRRKASPADMAPHLCICGRPFVGT